MQVSVSLRCLFCNDNLQGDTENPPQEGEMMVCTHCGEKNDFDSVREIAIQEGRKELEEAVLESFTKKMKKIFKK